MELDDIVYSISSEDTYDIDKILKGRGQQYHQKIDFSRNIE